MNAEACDMQDAGPGSAVLLSLLQAAGPRARNKYYYLWLFISTRTNIHSSARRSSATGLIQGSSQTPRLRLFVFLPLFLNPTYC